MPSPNCDDPAAIAAYDALTGVDRCPDGCARDNTVERDSASHECATCRGQVCVACGRTPTAGGLLLCTPCERLAAFAVENLPPRPAPLRVADLRAALEGVDDDAHLVATDAEASHVWLVTGATATAVQATAAHTVTEFALDLLGPLSDDGEPDDWGE